MTKKVLLLNGPPYCGKDTIASLVEPLGFKHVKFAKVLKDRTHALYGLNCEWDAYEGEIKDTPLPEFLGLSPRQAYINTSEIYMKPVHGQDVWAKMLVEEIKRLPNKKFVISDLGFQIEWTTLVNELGFEGLRLIKLTRDGKGYENDSREYVNENDITGMNFETKDQEEAYFRHVRANVGDYENNSDLATLGIDVISLIGGM